ncbi:unnamed protein product [Bursaphelenchus xylophilus]|uniref:ascorbate ferrireductase (transmembrane) n=1 Tax=Bursaphelenchus xylophilus TaxID=6326 RepID=A0A1I7S9B7_BURXY|nr:unnamed protein product [Bursaphelenchus xylophilus]CAG9100505.1 unnamed protein product [Bursaphelenchus xylophilus]
MELYGNLNALHADFGAYVAVGFSLDELMGQDTVTECASFQGRPFQGRLSSNPGKSNRKVAVDEISHDVMLQTISSHYSNNTLYCLLSQSIYPIAGLKNYYVRPLDQPYFIFLASGLTDGEELVAHALDEHQPNFPYVSQHAIDLKEFVQEDLAQQFNSTHLSSLNVTDIVDPSDVSNQTAKRTKLNRAMDGAIVARNDPAHKADGVQLKTKQRLTTAHGISMCVAWLILVPVAVLIARYGRKIWGPDRKLFNVPMWVHCHRFCNTLAAVIMVLSTLAIFAAHGWRWHGIDGFSGNPMELHSLLGFLACIFAWVQVINSICRCKVGTTPRKIHNIFHRTIGITALILGLITLALAIWNVFGKSSLPRIIFVIYLVVVVGIILMLEPLKWKLYCQKRRQQVHISEENDYGRKTKLTNFERKKQLGKNAAQKKQDAMVRRFQMVSIAACAVVATTITLLLSIAIIFRDIF